MDFLDEHVMPQVNAERTRNARGFKTCEMTWLNLKSGSFTTSELLGSIETFDGVVVHSVTSGDKGRLFKFWRLEYNGDYVGKYFIQDTIEKYDGEVVFNRTDEEFDPDAPDDLTKELIHRGEKFHKLLKGGCRYCNGTTANFPYHKVSCFLGFQTAVALAECDREKDDEGTIFVQERHLSSVVKMSLEFQEYLEKLHVGNEGKRAEREGERYDDYDQ